MSPSAALAAARRTCAPMDSGFASTLQITPWPPVADPLLGLALAAVAGALLGETLARWAGVPRVLGYSGVGLGLAMAGQGPTGGLPEGAWRLVVDLALGLLLFELGSRVRLGWLRDNPPLATTATVGAVAGAAAGFVVLRLLGHPGTAAAATALLLLPTSGAVVARVAAELRPGGQVGERMRVCAAVDAAVAVPSLALLIGWLHVERTGDWTPALAQPLYTVAGSIVLAGVLAAVIAACAHRLDLRNESAALLLLGLVVVTLMVARAGGLSTVLVPLSAGLLLRNVRERVWIWPRHFGSAGGALVLMMFVAVGSTASWGALAAGAGAALAVLAARLLAKGATVAALARASGIDTRQAVALTATLSPVSATSLVLWGELLRTHPAVAAQAAPVVLSAVALMSLAGPLAVQWGLEHAGEAVRASVRGRAAES